MSDGHLRATYNEIHAIIGKASERIAPWKPDLFVAIGGGGFFPARVLRSFLKHPATGKNISIQAIGLSLYEELPETTSEQIGREVVRTQWLGPESRALLGRRVLIIDEVDDSRTTLAYAIKELQHDVEEQLKLLPEAERDAKRSKFAVFVVHNKKKAKAAELPADIPYYAGEEIDDHWCRFRVGWTLVICTDFPFFVRWRPTWLVDYPWEARDIYEHDRLTLEGKKMQGDAAGKSS